MSRIASPRRSGRRRRSPRTEASSVVASLRRIDVGHQLMLTGDNERVAETIARVVGLDDWRAGLHPEDKTEAVLQLRTTDAHIAMVGDWVNDAPALTAADVGIARGAAGTDVAWRPGTWR
jgi:P-type E1-E2 ATPase